MSEHGKLVILGLDGATFQILRPLAEAGIMPTLARFLREGAWGTLRSTRPPVTCPAWPSMYTGVGPGKHGVFSFSYRDPRNGRVRTASGTDVPLPKLWDLAGQGQRRNAVLNVPITFPAQPLNGVMFSGFVSPDDSPLVSYPPSLANELRVRHGELKLNWLVLGYRPSDVQKRNAHVRKINDLMARRIAQFEDVLDHGEYDFCWFVHEYPDRVYHLYYHLLDESFPAGQDAANDSTRELLYEGHRLLDQSLQRLVERMGPDANILIVSDHGFGGVTKWVYLNNLLQQNGLAVLHPGRSWADLVSRQLNFSVRTRQALGLEPSELWHRQDPARAPLINYQRTQAFAGPQLEQAVYVNLRGRFPDGIVRPEDYVQVRQRVIDALVSARDPQTGEGIFEGVWSRDEAFPGPYLESAPDVVYELAPGYMTSNAILPPMLLGSSCVRPLRGGWKISGYHRPEGVFLGMGPAFATAPGLEASIVDIAPTVLYLMNLPIPDYMDGDVIKPAMKPSLLNGRARQSSRIDLTRAADSQVPYTEREQLEVTQRLEELGYL